MPLPLIAFIVVPMPGGVVRLPFDVPDHAGECRVVGAGAQCLPPSRKTQRDRAGNTVIRTVPGYLHTPSW
jgi:hypothetical protein